MHNTILRKTKLDENSADSLFVPLDIDHDASLGQLRIKSIFELMVCSLALVIIGLWLFPIVAVVIKATSKGPVFFKQLRHGKNNVPFYCYKFRTMVANDEADTLQAKKGDHRITKFGGILRKSSIDELPQLFNVMKGEMALVGPRPHTLPMNEIFMKEVPGYMNRHVMKPGITGLAQSKGCRGEIKDYNDLNHRNRLDMFYIKKWNLAFDLKILLWTTKEVLFNNKKAY